LLKKEPSIENPKKRYGFPVKTSGFSTFGFLPLFVFIKKEHKKSLSNK
jgi:hypothetical protein